MGVDRPFGDYLIDKGLLSPAAWERVQDVLEQAGQGLAGTITGLGLMSEKDLSLALADHFGLAFAGDTDWRVSGDSI